MIVKVLINGKEYGVDVYENNFDGEVQVNDTFHCEAKEDGRDTIFGTNDEMITIEIPIDEIKKDIKKEMVDDTISMILGRGNGNTYDRDMAFEKARDTLSDWTFDIADEVDKIMTKKYTTADSLTIRADLKDCYHKCGDCQPDSEECEHDCCDCGYFDGGNCLIRGCFDEWCACDCMYWDGGE